MVAHIRTISVTRRELEALLLVSLRAEAPGCDLRAVTIYRLGLNRWTVGHVRLGPSRVFPHVALDRVVRKLKQTYRIVEQ